MIIIWRGAGGLIFIIGIVVCLFINVLTSKVFQEDNYFQAHLWPKLAALGVIGASCWFAGRYFNGHPPQTVIDETTGQEIDEKPYHHFMFIKLEYWGVIFVGIGLGLLALHLASE
jgi:hypothetical protein